MPRTLLAGLQVACVSMRIGRGARKLEGVSDMDDGLLLRWMPAGKHALFACTKPQNQLGEALSQSLGTNGLHSVTLRGPGDGTISQAGFYGCSQSIGSI
jgi:hypothetical protein